MPPKKPVKKRPATKTPDPITMVLYGPSGNGKTSFCDQFPQPGFICDSQEKGVLFLQRRHLIPDPVFIDMEYDSSLAVDKSNRLKGGAKEWERLLDSIWEAARNDDIQTLVLESVTGFETICFIHHALENFDGDFGKQGFYSHWQGPISAARFDWPSLIDAMDGCFEAGKNVIITAHSQVREEEAPEGTALQRHCPYCEKHTWARLHRWASAVFFIGRRLERDTKAQGRKAKAKSDVFDRLLYVEGTPYCDAKNWLGLSGVIDLGESATEGYKNFCSVLGW